MNRELLIAAAVVLPIGASAMAFGVDVWRWDRELHAACLLGSKGMDEREAIKLCNVDPQWRYDMAVRYSKRDVSGFFKSWFGSLFG